MRSTAPLLMVLLAAGCASAPEWFPVAGSVRAGGHAAAGAVISASDRAGRAFTVRADGEGRFLLPLPAGSFSLTGRGADAAGRPLTGWWGGNPLGVTGAVQGDDGPTLALVPDPGPPRERPEPGIGGRVLLEGTPAAGVSVAAYLAGGEALRGPPYLNGFPTGEDGTFELPLPPGRYELTARRRAKAGEGPLGKGDLFGVFPGNPVTLREGQGLSLDIPVAEVKKPRPVGTLAAGEGMVVTGTLRDAGGKPVPGARALLYPTPSLAGRPAFISAPADEAGRYRLEVSRPGRFYLAARVKTGAPPEPGELQGTYHGTDDHSLTLSPGKPLSGVDLTMEPTP